MISLPFKDGPAMVMIEWIDPSVDVYLQINKPTLGLGAMYNYMSRVCLVIRELVTSPTSLIFGHPFGCRTIHSNLYAHALLLGHQPEEWNVFS
jgi:hypothetical protein